MSSCVLGVYIILASWLHTLVGSWLRWISFISLCCVLERPSFCFWQWHPWVSAPSLAFSFHVFLAPLNFFSSPRGLMAPLVFLSSLVFTPSWLLAPLGWKPPGFCSPGFLTPLGFRHLHLTDSIQDSNLWLQWSDCGGRGRVGGFANYNRGWERVGRTQEVVGSIYKQLNGLFFDSKQTFY